MNFGVMQDEDGETQVQTTFRLDVAVTDYHGFQGDVAFEDTANGLIGTVGAHLYMTPREGERYGLFGALSDVDGRSMTWGSVGVEGMVSMGEYTVIEGRAGMGMSDVDGLDYIFAGASIVTALSEASEVAFHADFAEFDEVAFQAISYNVGAIVRYSPAGAPWGVYASLTQSGLTGDDSAPGETRFGLGVSMTFGATGGIDPKYRPFRTIDPVAPLVRRGLW